MTLRIDLSTPFGVRSVRSARKAIRAMAGEWYFSTQALREIELSFSEALQNAMEHGSSGTATITTISIVSEKGLQIIIEDPGAGERDCNDLKAVFDKADRKTPDLEEERGRGLYLIRSLMDASAIECMEGGGVRIILFKKRS